VQRVGERRPQQGGYGYPQAGQAAPQQPGRPGGYGYPPQAPNGYGQGPYDGGATQQYPAQQPHDAPQPPPGGGRRGGPAQGPDGPNRKGLLIGAVAVVAAVAIGIAFAMTNGSGDGKKQADDKPTGASASASAPSQSSTPSASDAPFASPKVDVSTLALGGTAAKSTEHSGAKAAGGVYVDSITKGSSATWTVTVPKDDTYTFFVSYGNAGDDATLTLGVNDKADANTVKLNNYTPGNTDWAKAWATTFNYVALKKGANSLTMSCGDKDTNCGVNLDQVWIKEGQVTK
jgi:hypothetical protein